MVKGEGSAKGIGRDSAYYVNAEGELVPVPTEFYNTSHGEDGRFDEGPDGPGRVRDPGTEDLGKPGYVSKPSKKDKNNQVIVDGEGEPGRQHRETGSYDAAKGKDVIVPTMADVKKAPPSAKTVREINKGLGVGKDGIGSYPDWTKYPGAPADTSGDNWENWIKTEGGKKFLADVEAFEGPKQEDPKKPKKEKRVGGPKKDVGQLGRRG